MTPNVHPMVRVGAAAHFKIYNNAWHRTETYPGKCTCGIDPMTAAAVRPSIDDSWRYVPDSAWGACLSKLVRHENANAGGTATFSDGYAAVIGMRVAIDSDAAHLYEQGRPGEWFLESVGKESNGDVVPVATLRDKSTGVYVKAPLHWLTSWVPPGFAPEPPPAPWPELPPDEVAGVQMAFVLEPTSDSRLVCFLCRKKKCTHEFAFRGEGERAAIGAHVACLHSVDGAGVTSIR